jgi:hypothetical protein
MSSRALVADAEATVLVQPGDRAFNDPALFAEPRAVPSLRGGDPRLDAVAAQLAPSLARVVGAVAVEPFRPAAGTAAAAAHGRNPSTSGIIWVMSLRLPPVSPTVSGLPRPQAIR